MGTSYTVRQGDTLTLIARRNGYDTWEEIYYHDDNRAFRQRRPNPSEIHAGDTLILPDRTATPGTEEPPQPDTPGGGGSGGSGFVPGVGPRRTTTGTARTVLNTAYELREIVIAQGVEAHNSDLPDDWAVPRSVQPMLPDNGEHEWVSCTDTAAEFLSHVQRVRFRVRLVDVKDEYKRCLQTAGLHVVYVGHARYGRGPCFGADPSKGEHWENGSDPNTNGIYRMGYPVILIPVSDMEHHGYSFHPVPSSQQIQRSWCHPDVSRGRLRSIPHGDIPEEIRDRVRPSPPVPAFWGIKSGSTVSKLLLWANWEDTVSTPMDLGATNLRCRCFCHFGCSTKKHNWRIVRQRKNWQRTETDRFAYFTTATSVGITTKYWLRALFEYSQRNDFQSWFPSLEWARRRCSQLVHRAGFHYSIW